MNRFSRQLLLLVCTAFAAGIANAQSVTLDPSPKGQHQVIDGFGTYMGDADAAKPWFAKLAFDELRCSIVRVDLTARFKSPWIDHTYNSPWFHHSPSLPGPDGNNVRTYTSAADYTREYAGQHAQIAVMGPDIDDNIRRYFDYDSERISAGGNIAKLAEGKREALGDVKLYGSQWTPPGWLKVSSGNTISGSNDPMPKNNAAFPFVWFDNFAGGMLDTSGEPRKEFDDSALPGGTGPTSALTQFARNLAAWTKGYQDHFGVKFYAISIQNEPHLEVFYNSCLYRTTAQYIAALKATKAEFSKYPTLRDIRLIGPEDTIGADSTYLWFWDNNKVRQDKLLHFMQDIEADPVAAKALDFYCVHGYAADGITSAGAEARVWEWSAHGWDKAPDPQVPDHVKGYEDFGKKCWMTETSGEKSEWLYPQQGFPTQGAFSIALKIHQALVVGDATAWLYWTLAQDKKVPEDAALTGPDLMANCPKAAAFEHYSRFIRPGARRIDAAVAETKRLKASAFINDKDHNLVMVLINAGKEPMDAKLNVPESLSVAKPVDSYLSDEDHIWRTGTIDLAGGKASVTLPRYSVMTIVAPLAN